MRFLTTTLAIGLMVALTAPVLACDKDHSAKADQGKQRTAQTTGHPVQTDGKASKPHGG